MAYLRLDLEILDSSIWSESPVVLKVFLTMLMMADEHGDGICPATAPGIAGRARLSLRQTVAALAILEAPDPHDKSGVEQGVRVKRSPGGYQLVNWQSYNKKDHTAAERQRRHRAGKRGEGEVSRVTSVTSRVTSRHVTHADAYEEVTSDHDGSRGTSVVAPTISVDPREQTSSASALAKPEPVVAQPVDQDFAWSKTACDDWIARFGGVAPGGQIGKFLEPLVRRHHWPTVRKAWIRYLQQAEAQYASPARFSATFGKWAGFAPDPSPKDDVTVHNERFLQDYAAARRREEGLGADAAKVLPPMPKGRR